MSDSAAAAAAAGRGGGANVLNEGMRGLDFVSCLSVGPSRDDGGHVKADLLEHDSPSGLVIETGSSIFQTHFLSLSRRRVPPPS